MGVAIENARLFEAEQQRVAELQIINSIQQGLAAELDFQAIVDLVGDKLREVFNTPDLGINWYDEKTNLLALSLQLSNMESGLLFHPTSDIRAEYLKHDDQKHASHCCLITSRLITKNSAKSRSQVQTRANQLVSVPIISSDRVLGIITLENYERENAYGESELRLLTTIAASLGAALENARLFDETQRLLKDDRRPRRRTGHHQQRAGRAGIQTGYASHL